MLNVGTMKIHSVRFGFATNSSSSHSIVWLPGAEEALHEPGYYGWDDFVLTSTPSKMSYLGQQIIEALRRQVGNELASVIAKHMTGHGDPDGHVTRVRPVLLGLLQRDEQIRGNQAGEQHDEPHLV